MEDGESSGSLFQQGNEVTSTKESLVVMLTVDPRMAVFQIYEDSTLEEIYMEVMKKSEKLRSDLFLRYYPPKVEQFVTLDEDKDVRNMFVLHKSLKENVVRMEATSNQDGSNNAIESVENDAFYVDKVSSQITNYVDWKKCLVGVGQEFESAQDLRICLKNYSITWRINFQYVKNDSSKIIVICHDASNPRRESLGLPTSKGQCEWRVYASSLITNGVFRIRRCNLEHTCDVGKNSESHHNADASWVAAMIKNKIRTTPFYRAMDIRTDIFSDYGVHISYSTAWRGKELAIREIFGSDNSAYENITWYCDAVKVTNTGSVAFYEGDEISHKFRRLFIAFGACLSGFVEGCRPIIFLDETHIKNKFKGTLLYATSKDADNGLFTIAFAVVDAEDEDNWLWFCERLHKALYDITGEERSYVIFSDRNLALLKVVPMVFHGSYHSYCLRYLIDNFKKKVLTKVMGVEARKDWVGKFKAAAHTPFRYEFQNLVSEICNLPKGKEFLLDSEPCCWANSVFPSCRWGIMDNNIAECFNNWIRDARYMPIDRMVDHIRRQIMTMMNDKRERGIAMKKKILSIIRIYLGKNKRFKHLNESFHS